MIKRWIMILAALAVLGGIIGWRLYSKNKEAQDLAKARAARSKSAPPVTVVPVVARDIVHTYIGVGSAEAPFNIRLAPKLSGRLDYLQVREGASVTQGEVLARIDPSQIQAQISQQQASIAEAQSRLAQAQITQNPTNVSVTTQIEQQRAGLQSAQADANQVKQNYSSQVAAAQSAVTDVQGRVDNAKAAISNAEAAIRSAQANVENAQIRYNRTYDIYKQGFVAAQDVDDARTTLKVQQEALDVAQGQLRSAQSARDSATAQLNAAQKQADIVVVKGKADIAAAVAKVEQAQSALKYAKSNTAQRPAYVQNIAALRSAVTAAQAQLRNLQSQLSDTILTSPISGFVTARYVDPGSIVSPSQPVITIQSAKQIFVTVSVPEEVSGKLKQRQPADVVFDALPNQRFVGKVTQINPAADPQSRQFTVRITLDNPQNVVKAGMFARVTLVTDRIPGALVVPREAIHKGKQGPYVVVVDADGTAHIRPVQTGAEDVTGVQIREGVRANEQVVTLANAAIREGQKVRSEGKAQPDTGGGVAQTGGGGAPAANNAGGGAGNSQAGGQGGGPAIAPGGQTGNGSASASSNASPGSGQTTTNTAAAPGQTTAPVLNGQPQTGATTPPVYTNPANPSGAQNTNPPPQIQQPTPSSVPGNGSNSGAGGAPGGNSGAQNGSGGTGGR